MSYHPQGVSEPNMDAHGGVSAPFLGTQPGRGHHGHAGVADPNLLMNHFAGMALGGMGMPNNSAPMHMGPGPAFMVGPDGQFVLAPMQAGQPMGLGHGNENPYQNFPMASGGYTNPYMGMTMPLMPYTPGRANSTQPRNDRGHSDVPGLENRRGSYSTTESTPATPFYGAVSNRENGPRVASLDRSAYTTPSPQQLGLSNLHVDAAPKPALNPTADRALDDLLKKSPAVPKAVPAVFTPPGQMKSLEQSLENRIPGNRNVYIRGLHPTTDDELLYHFAARFGPVETSKAIIDTGTGACKGLVVSIFTYLSMLTKQIRLCQVLRVSRL